MLNISENSLQNREYVERLVELVDTGFDHTDYVWHQFVNPWEENFAIDSTQHAKLDNTWIPSNKQVLHICSIIGKLEFRLEEIREYYS